jgi:hypothetical protein
MKARKLSFFEIEEQFKTLIVKFEDDSLDKDYIIQKGNLLLFTMGLCISQMKAADSKNYPDKAKHLKILEEALSAITFKLNTSTIDEVVDQISSAYKSFGIQ